MSEQLELWEEEKGDVSIDDMTAAVRQLREAKNLYDTKKLESNALHAEMKTLEERVTGLMKLAGLTEFTATGYGKVSLSELLSVKTPKSPDEKKAFFSWVRENMGDDAYYAYMSVNSASLNSMYRHKVEEYGERGEVLEVAGLEAPTSYTKLSLRKA
jgi:hypothetical protein